jgi:hypothetical protein
MLHDSEAYFILVKCKMAMILIRQTFFNQYLILDIYGITPCHTHLRNILGLVCDFFLGPRPDKKK